MQSNGRFELIQEEDGEQPYRLTLVEQRSYYCSFSVEWESQTGIRLQHGPLLEDGDSTTLMILLDSDEDCEWLVRALKEIDPQNFQALEEIVD